MLLYNITIKIDHKVQEDWLAWMKKTHIPAYLASGLFTSYKFCRILGDEDEHGISYALQLFCPDEKTFQIYQQLHSRRLQKAQADRYPEKYVIFRTIMEVVSHS